MAEQYGKANGNGPLHLLADFNGKTVTLCGVTRFTAHHANYYGDPERHGMCPRCIAVRERMDPAAPPPRPDGPDLITPAILQARAEVVRATKAYESLVSVHKRSLAWMRQYPEERKAFVDQMRALDTPLGTIGDLLGVTREYVRQLAAQ